MDFLPLYGRRFYQNPLKDITGQVPTNPDPFVLKFQGRYYCYSSYMDGVRVSISPDLIQWQPAGFALQEDKRKDFWAPCVIYANGTFYMYYSNVPDKSTDPHDEFLRLATSKTPEGPFQYQKNLFHKFSIDAEVVKDKTGNYYIFYSTNDITGTDPENTGTTILVDRLLNFDQVAGEPTPAILPTLEQEIFKQDRFGDGRDWYTIEGANYLEHRDTAYLLYSANAYLQEDYYISYATAENDAPIHQLQWEKYPNDYTYHPLIKRNQSVEGTGHNSLVKAPNNIDDWLIYHGRNATEPLLLDQEQRTMRMDQLFFDGDVLMTYAPSFSPQPAPSLPDVQEFFQGLVQLETLSGEAMSTEKGWLTTESPFFALYDKPYCYYHLEVDLSAKPASVGSKNGAIIAYFNKNDYVSVYLKSGTSTLTVEQIKNGIHSVLAVFSLKNFDATVGHNLKVIRCFRDYELYLNDKFIARIVLDERPAQVGITSLYTSTVFHHFAVTEVVHLYAGKMKLIGNLLASTERVQVNRLNQLASFKRNPATLTFDMKQNWRYSFTYTLPAENSTIAFRFFARTDQMEVTIEPDKITIDKLQVQNTFTKVENDKSTVRFLVIDQKLMILFKNKVYQYALPPDQDSIHCQIELQKAAIDSYQAIKLNG